MKIPTANIKDTPFATVKFQFVNVTPKLALLSRAWTWDKVLECLVVCGLDRFVRTKKEVDKDAVLAFAAAAPTNADSIRINGMKVVQNESFFVEPNLTDTEVQS